jgi:F0F1-type ATP synthase assembly protein I
MAPKPNPSDSWAGLSTGLAITTTMLAGPVVWGAIGYLIDRLAGTGKVFTAIGMIVGAVAAGYLVYLRYGKDPMRTDEEPKRRA